MREGGRHETGSEIEEAAWKNLEQLSETFADISRQKIVSRFSKKLRSAYKIMGCKI